MKLENIIFESYPLIDHYLNGLPLQLNKQHEKKAALQIQWEFSSIHEYYIKNGLSLNKNKTGDSYIKRIDHLKSKALSTLKPELALLGFLYIAELYNDFQMDNHNKKFSKPFQNITKEFKSFFESQPNETIKEVFLQSKIIADKNFNKEIDSTEFAALAEEVMSPKPQQQYLKIA